LMRIGTKILTCQIQEHVKKIIIHGWVVLIPGT
jgi:hypothetical protein